jgi:rubredoxin
MSDWQWRESIDYGMRYTSMERDLVLDRPLGKRKVTAYCSSPTCSTGRQQRERWVTGKGTVIPIKSEDEWQCPSCGYALFFEMERVQ